MVRHVGDSNQFHNFSLAPKAQSGYTAFCGAAQTARLELFVKGAVFCLADGSGHERRATLG